MATERGTGEIKQIISIEEKEKLGKMFDDLGGADLFHSYSDMTSFRKRLELRKEPSVLKEWLEQEMKQNANLEKIHYLFEKLEFDNKACSALVQTIFYLMEFNLFTRDNFIKAFSVDKENIKSFIILVKIMMTHSSLLKQNDFDILLKNAPFSRYILHASEKNRSQDIIRPEGFDFFMDEIKFVSPETLLKRKKLKLLIKDIKNSRSVKKITIDSPITEHAARVYEYQSGGKKATRTDDDTESDSESDEEGYDANAITGLHGITHVAAVAFYVPVMINFLARHGNEEAKKLTPEDIKLIQIAALFHDIGREEEGEDFWDHDSGLILYYYLTSVLGVEKEKAKMLAEVTANKDAQSQGFYRHLVEYEEGKFRWDKTTEIPPPNIYGIVLHEVDSLDIKRARRIYDASYLDTWQLAKKNEVVLDELAQLITEVHGGITERGEAYGDRNVKVKKRYISADAYQAIGDIFISKETVDEKKKDLLAFERSTHYRLIPRLYNPNGFNDSMSLEKLPTATLLSAANDWESRMRNGELYARAIISPTEIVKLKDSKRTGQPKPKETRAEFEWRKIQRQEGIETRSGATNKRGFDLRSCSMLGYNSATYGRVGFVIHAAQLDDIMQLNTTNIVSGFGKKEAFRKKIHEEKDKNPDAEKQKKLEQHKKLVHYSKTGHDPLLESQKKTAHNEVIMTITNASAILISQSYKKKGDKDRSTHPYADILQAVYLQKMCAANEVILPILEYSNNPSVIKEKTVTDDQIVDMWTKICTHYLQEGKAIGSDLSKMTVEELQTRSMYGLQPSDSVVDYDPADKYYDSALKQRVTQAMTAVQAKFYPAASVNVSSRARNLFVQTKVDSSAPSTPKVDNSPSRTPK